MVQKLRFALVVPLAVLLACLAAGASELQERPVKRAVLALYDGAQEGSADATRIHRFAELPLNHLGYILQYRDVRQGLPAPQELAPFAAVLTWFTGPLDDGDAYLAWASRAAKEGVRFVVLGDLGAAITARNRPAADDVMSLFGLRHTGANVAPADGSRVTRQDNDLHSFECRLDPALPDYPVLEAVSTQVRVGLQLAVPPHIGDRLTSLVAIGERGGFAAFNYEFCHQAPPLHRGKWLIDPFVFFRAALGAPAFPIPDPTTLSGRRIYFSLVDSDGWSAPVEFEKGGQERKTAADIVARELIEPFPELAVTLDVREADAARAGGAAPSWALLERLLALPQVTRPGKHAIGSRHARLDARYDSISNLAPFATAGAPRVALTATGTDLAYEAGGARWSTDLFSLRDTLRRSGWPRRLKPANINFHMGAGRDRATLNILRRHLEAARATAVAPISAGLYADIVDGFFTAEIADIGESTWRITGRGGMQTFRLDNIGAGAVDIERSRGVVGYTRHGDTLYVTLDEAVEPAVIRVVDASLAASGMAGAALADSRWRLRKLVREHSRIAFEAEGYGPGELSWWMPPGITCQVTAGRDDTRLWSASPAADASGRLNFTVPVSAVTPLTIEIDACRP